MPYATFDSLVLRHRVWFFVLGHPGHELRAYHVLERVRPIVSVLTDGSGSGSEPRITDSASLITRVGGQPASVFGAMTDRAAYEALMAGDARAFLRVADALTDALIGVDATAVVIDAAEGYNPVHDICNWIGRAVIARVIAAGRDIDAFELDLIAHPDGDGDGVRVPLDDGAFARKLEAIGQYRALAGEAAAAFERYGRDAFRVEFLRCLPPARLRRATWMPFYERVGEERVRSGQYSDVLRYGRHVRPVLAALDSAGVRSDADARRPTHQ